MSVPSYPPPPNFTFTAGTSYPSSSNGNAGPPQYPYNHPVPAPGGGTAYHYPNQPPSTGYGGGVGTPGQPGPWSAGHTTGNVNGWQQPPSYAHLPPRPPHGAAPSGPVPRYGQTGRGNAQPRGQTAVNSFPSVPAFGAPFPPIPPTPGYTHPSTSHSHNQGRSFSAGGSRPFDRGHRAPGPRNNPPAFNQNYKRGRDQHPHSDHHHHRPGKKIQGEKSQLPAPSPLHALPPKPPKPVASSSRLANKPKRKPRNVLGLLPEGDDAPSSEDEADEEAAFGASGAAFESSGGAVNLRTPQEIQRWIAERKKKFPTKANIAAKEALRSAAETLGRSHKAAAQAKPMQPQLLSGYASSDEEAAEDDKANKPPSAAAKPEEQPAEARVDSKAVSPEFQPTGEDDGGEAPTELSIKREPVPSPFDRKHDRSADQVYCKTWARLGFCTWKRCKFLHRLPGVTDGKANEEYAQKQHAKHRRNLYQEFVKQEELEKQNVALQVIKFLGHSGHFA